MRIPLALCGAVLASSCTAGVQPDADASGADSSTGAPIDPIVGQWSEHIQVDLEEGEIGQYDELELEIREDLSTRLDFVGYYGFWLGGETEALGDARYDIRVDGKKQLSLECTLDVRLDCVISNDADFWFDEDHWTFERP